MHKMHNFKFTILELFNIINVECYYDTKNWQKYFNNLTDEYYKIQFITILIKREYTDCICDIFSSMNLSVCSLNFVKYLCDLIISSPAYNDHPFVINHLLENANASKISHEMIDIIKKYHNCIDKIWNIYKSVPLGGSENITQKAVIKIIQILRKNKIQVPKMIGVLEMKVCTIAGALQINNY